MQAYIEGLERQYYIQFHVNDAPGVRTLWDEFRNSLSLRDVLVAYGKHSRVVFDPVVPSFRLVQASYWERGVEMSHLDYRFVGGEALVEVLQPVLPAQVRAASDRLGVHLLPADGLGPIRREAVQKVLNELRSYRTGDFYQPQFTLDRAATIYSAMEEFGREFPAQFPRKIREVMTGSYGGRPIPTHDTSDNLRSFMRKVKDSMTIESNPIEKLPVLEHGTKSSRTWGIEVEAGGARGVSAPAYWDRKYDGSLESAYDDGGRYIDPEDCYYAENHREYIDEERWLEVGDEDPDGNIVEEGQEGYFMFYEVENPDYQNPDYCEDCGTQYDSGDDDDDTGEFVSPVLHSFHSRGLENLLSELVEQPQNDSAGIHVHVGADGLTPKQIGSLVFAYQIVEPLIEGSYFRRTRSYCKVRNEVEFRRIVHDAKRVKYRSYVDASRADGGSGTYLNHGDRYVSLNLCALEDHGTVEFRAMGPKYDSYEHLVKWALFCREMVNCAAANVPVRVWAAVSSFDDVIAIFRAYGKEMNDGLVDNELRALLEEELEEV